MDGIDVIKRLRVWSQVPVLAVSARHGSEADPSHPRHLITAPGMGNRFEA
ncbi:hypothetical protein ACWGNM_22745 [Streptomyces sp. NPDC055796]